MRYNGSQFFNVFQVGVHVNGLQKLLKNYQEVQFMGRQAARRPLRVSPHKRGIRRWTKGFEICPCNNQVQLNEHGIERGWIRQMTRATGRRIQVSMLYFENNHEEFVDSIE